jgi:hypothetical protein
MTQKARERAREPVHGTHFEEKTFDHWPLKNGETVRVSIDNYQGHDLVHVRRCRRGPNGELYPTQKGVAIQIGHLGRLLKALRAVRGHARAIGLLPEAAKRRRSANRRGRK